MLCGSAFAPIIEYVISLVYKLMKAIQSLIFAFSGINIFAKATASSMNRTAGSASKASKSLAGVHNEINNVSENNNSSGGETVTPTMDLSQVDSQLSPLGQKLYDFFKPLKDSWDSYGTQVIDALKNAFSGISSAVGAMWSSLETVFTNGTIYSIISNILNSIGAIGGVWANAWTNDNNGTELVQGIADIINDITEAVLKLVSSTGFQAFLDGIVSAFSGLVQFLRPVISGFVEMAEIILEIIMSAIGTVLQTIGDILQAIGQNETAVEILKAVGAAIAIIVAAITLWNVVQAILNGLMGLFAILTSPITLIILGIVAAITAIILIIKNWGSISEWFGNLWLTITDKIKLVWNSIKKFFIDTWNNILKTAKSIWNEIKTAITTVVTTIKDKVKEKFNTIKTNISTIVTNIKTKVTSIFTAIKTKITTIVTTIKTKVTNAFTTIKNKIKTIMTNVKTTISNIWNGIWSIVRGVINKVLGGIEGFANGIVRGINKVLSGLDGVVNAVGKVIGVDIHVNPLSEISLPRLAKGGVLYEETAFVGGEYSNANSNPEIVAPQSIMYDTMLKALSDSDFANNNDTPIYLTVNVGNQKLGQILLSELRDKRRRTGKGIEALIGG